MVTINKSVGVTHQSPKIQYNDKAIAELKFNKKLAKRERIDIGFKNGPVGVSLRWTLKSNKKVFQLLGKCRGQTFRMHLGQFHLGAFGTHEVDTKLTPIFKKHKDIDGTWLYNPKKAVVTLKETPKLLVNDVIELLCEQNFPRRHMKGNLAATSQRDYTRFLIGYNHRRDHITFDDNQKGHGQILFKEKSKIQDWKSLFKKYPTGTGIIQGGKFNRDNELSVYDSSIGSSIIDDLIVGHIKGYLESKTRTFGQKDNILKALSTLWGFALKRNLLGPNPPMDPTRRSHGGITIEKEESSNFIGSKWNETGLDLEQCEEIETALFSLTDRYPFQAEACLLLMYTGMRITECLKLKKTMLGEDEDGDPILTMPRVIMKGRSHQSQRDVIYDIREGVETKVIESLKKQYNKPNLARYRCVPFLFPTTRINIKKLANPDQFPDYANSSACRTRTLDDTFNAVKEITGLQCSIKTLKKANIHWTNDKLGGAHKGKFVSKHKTEQVNSGTYDKASRKETKQLAIKAGQVFQFQKKN